MSNHSKPESKRGPRAERVKSDKEWEDAMKGALKKQRPEGGWPEPEKKKRDSDS